MFEVEKIVNTCWINAHREEDVGSGSRVEVDGVEERCGTLVWG